MIAYGSAITKSSESLAIIELFGYNQWKTPLCEDFISLCEAWVVSESCVRHRV